MDKENGVTIGFSPRAPARVLACLTRSTITVIVHPGVGLSDGGSKIILPIGAVPPDLRMPNSEFDVIFDGNVRGYTRVVRKGVPDSVTEYPSPSVIWDE